MLIRAAVPSDAGAIFRVHTSVIRRVCSAHLEDFPDSMAYVATEWLAAGGVPAIVLLETHH
jgi:hypothetical protein